MSNDNSDKQAFPSLALFRERNFLWLWLAQIISNLGDWALLVVIPVTVYNGTNSKTALGLSMVSGAVPVLLFGLVGGVFADRWNRRRTMIFADLSRAAALLLLLGISDTKHLNPRDLGVFYAVAFVVSSFSCFFTPARQGLMTALLPREKLLSANGIILSGTQATLLLGPALGGLLLTVFHPKGVFIFDAATFAASALLVSLIKNVATPPGAKAARGVSGVWQDACEGLNFVWTSRVLRPSLLLLSIVVIGGQIYNTLEFPFVRDLWGGTGRDYAWLVSLGGLAALLTGLATGGPIRSAPPSRLVGFGFSVMGLAGLGFASATNIYFGGTMIFLMAVANTFSNLGMMTLFLSTAPNHIQGRVSGTISLVNRLSMAVGATFATGLTAFFHASAALRPIFECVGAAYVLCGLLAWLMLGRLHRNPPEPVASPEPLCSVSSDPLHPKKAVCVEP